MHVPTCDWCLPQEQHRADIFMMATLFAKGNHLAFFEKKPCAKYWNIIGYPLQIVAGTYATLAVRGCSGDYYQERLCQACPFTTYTSPSFAVEERNRNGIGRVCSLTFSGSNTGILVQSRSPTPIHSYIHTRNTRLGNAHTIAPI
jgi:hypothetical protein